MSVARGGRAACGRAFYGKATAGGGIESCFTCGRVGGRDGIAGGWKHIGNSSYRASLGEWAAQLGQDWLFDRDLSRSPLQYGECVCSRRGCVDNLYPRCQAEAAKDEKGSLDNMATGQPSRMGRHPSISSQVRGLLANVDMEAEGRGLDSGGAIDDAVAKVMSAHGFHVSTNDLL